MKTMKEEVKGWQQHRNNKEATNKWESTDDKARVKLKRLCPTIFC
jgi:hypothetical protein